MRHSPVHLWPGYVRDFCKVVPIENDNGNMKGDMLMFTAKDLAKFVEWVLVQQIEFEAATRISQLGIAVK